MPKPTSYPTLINEARTISLTDLKAWGYLEPNQIKQGSVSWSFNGQKRASIGITVNTYNEPQAYLLFHYTIDGNKAIKYKVNMFQKPSNLGKGFIWWFMCPQTNRPCRKLYLNNGYFLHRDAMKGAMYECQTFSKYGRMLDRYFGLEHGLFSVYDQINAKHFKKYYKGQPTKKYLKLMKRIKQAEKQSPIDARALILKS